MGVLESLASDQATAQRYARFCQSLIWGETPSYAEVTGAFTAWARVALGALSREDGYDKSGAQIA
ncbi:hypothetical protein [Acidiferrobacter sp.]|uniref:hypothetical protein n=1 Tax=Acidiferrobacter sp. TaxID=1872107 RepID=UPI00260E1CC1|nr:hypothetical protein [Acidiferrobacter sp.]